MCRERQKEREMKACTYTQIEIHPTDFNDAHT